MRFQLTLHLQAREEGDALDGPALVKAAKILPGRGVNQLFLSDAGRAALGACLARGGRIAPEPMIPLGRAWQVHLRFPDGTATITREDRSGSPPVLALAFDAPMATVERVAKDIHTILGDRAWTFSNANAMRALGVDAEAARRAWADALHLPRERVNPPPPPAKAPGERAPPPVTQAIPRAALDALAALGLREGAPWEHVQRAYRVMALKLHPDRTGGDASATREFERMTDAYAHLRQFYRR